jgi:hypothetical protein
VTTWSAYPLGDLLCRRNEPIVLESDREYRTMGVRWYGKGAYDRGLQRGHQIKAKRLNVARTGDFVFNRIDTHKGAFDIVPPELDGALVTNEFPLYVARSDDVSLRFILLHFELTGVLKEIESARAGTEGRARWKEADFEAHQVRLPRRSHQDAVVDLVAGIDGWISSLRAQLEASTALIRLGISAELSHVRTTVRVGDVAEVSSGASWTRRQESSDPRPGSTRVIKITNTKPDGSLSPAEQTYVTDLPKSVSVIDERSLVLIRTNGNPGRIGNVYRPGQEFYGSAVSAFQFHMRVLDARDRNFMYWALRDDKAQYAMSFASSGSTGLRNLAASWLREYEIPWPNHESRDEVASRCESYESAHSALVAELASAENLRRHCLERLLLDEVPPGEVAEQIAHLVEN